MQLVNYHSDNGLWLNANPCLVGSYTSNDSSSHTKSFANNLVCQSFFQQQSNITYIGLGQLCVASITSLLVPGSPNHIAGPIAPVVIWTFDCVLRARREPHSFDKKLSGHSYSCAATVFLNVEFRASINSTATIILVSVVPLVITPLIYLLNCIVFLELRQSVSDAAPTMTTTTCVSGSKASAINHSYHPVGQTTYLPQDFSIVTPPGFLQHEQVTKLLAAKIDESISSHAHLLNYISSLFSTVKGLNNGTR